MALTPINTYTVAHGKKGTGGGGGSYYNGGSRLSGIANVKSINAATGNISNLTVNNLRANNANIIYLTSQEGNIFKLSGEECHYNYGYFNNIAMDRLSTKKLKVDDLEAINAVIETLNSKNITTEYLTVTKQAHFFELVIDKIRAAGGQIILSPASCELDYVYALDYQGNVITESSHSNYKTEVAHHLGEIGYFDVYWRSTGNDGKGITNDFRANDLAICQNFNSAQEGVSHDVANKYYWRQVTNIIDDIYINLSTGAKSLNANESDYNRFEVKMYHSLQKTDNNDFVNNEILWDCHAQTIEGIQTGVTWTGKLNSDYTLSGEFCTNSNLFGIQFTPIQTEGINTPITNKIQFNIKKYYDNLGQRMYVKPNKMNIGVYFEDDSFIFFNDIQVNPESYDVEFDLGNPDTAISAITIVCTEEINWHKCHGIRISNKYIYKSQNEPNVPADNSGCDYMVVPEASVPEVGDNLVQLGNKTDTTRQSAIIIAAYMTPDAGLTAPSYAQYMGINDFHLAAHRQSYIDANGAKFIGDITLCSVDGKSISEALETSNKKIITNTDIVQVYQSNGADPVITIIPDNIGISILMPEEGDTSSTVVTYTVPHGYVVQLTYYNNNNQPISAQSLDGYDTIFHEDDDMSSINLYKSDTITGVHMVRIKLLKEVNGEQIADYPVVDMKDINYIMGAEDGENGGHYEFRYKNAVTKPTKPLEGFDGTTDGWSAQATTPDFTIGEFTWMTQCFVDEDDVYGEWTDPIRITGDNGKDGEDGTLVEFIYAHNDTGVAPDAPVNDASSNPVNTQDDWHGADSHGIIWYDNPQGVGPNSKYEYVSSRQRAANATIWGSFSTPVVWSKWGEKGMDGDGYEYIYALTAEKVAPANPTPQDISTDQYQEKGQYAGIEYIPTGWTDDPQQISQTYPFQWVCVRKRINGIWGAYDGPVLWARYAEVGETGGHYEFRYKNAATKPAVPTGTGLTDGWSNEPTTPDIEHGEYTWMSQSFVTPDSGGDIYGTWTDPIRITGPRGDTGADGTEIEFIYKVQNSSTAPSTPSTAQQDDYIPTGWTDNPSGVSADNMYEFVSTRSKNDNVWSSFSTPVIWSKWGEKGQDGDGFEYIYKLSANLSMSRPTMPSDWQSPTSNYQTHDEYVSYLSSEGWKDDPQSVSQTFPYQWVSIRKKHAGVWGAFDTPALWSRYAEVGDTGGHYEFRYKNATSQPSSPTGTGLTGGWSNTPTTPDFQHNEYTWMSQSYVTPNRNGDVYGTWTTPVRITGNNGLDGEDGTEIEFIYKVQNSSTAPSKPSTVQQDDYIPTGWTDNPSGVSANNMYEFVCTRSKNNNVWSSFSTPVIWSKWGEKGQDGDGFEYIYKLSGEQNSLTGPTMPSNWQNPTSDYQTHDEYVSYLSSEGWSDDPKSVSVNANERICWVSVRKKTNGAWGRFSTPAKWSNYVLADQGQPGAAGQDAELNYLIPVKETLVAKMINAISNQTNCDLQCELQYNLVHLKGDRTNTLTWSSQTWYLRISAYNSSFNRINYAYYYATSDGTSSGTPQGTYSKSNFMTQISYADSDYMKCYQNKTSYCPIYLLVELMNGNTVMDTRTVPVQVETGAVLKVTNDAITSAVGDSKTYVDGVLVSYSTTTQTAGMITSQVNQSLTNYYTKDLVYTKSQVDQTANSITSTVSSQASSINTLNSDMRTVKSDVSTLKQTATSLTSTISSHTTSINSLDGKVKTQGSSISTLQQTAASLQSQITTNLNNTNGSITSLQTQINQLPDSIELKAEKVFLDNSKQKTLSSVLKITSGYISMETDKVIISGGNSSKGQLRITNARGSDVIVLDGGNVNSPTIGLYPDGTTSNATNIDVAKITLKMGNARLTLWGGSQPYIQFIDGSNYFKIGLNGSGKVIMGGSTNIFPTTQTRGYIFMNGDDCLEMAT